MQQTIQSVEVRVIDQMKYKETHGLFINGDLQYRGTEHECRFFQLKLMEKKGEARKQSQVNQHSTGRQ